MTVNGKLKYSETMKRYKYILWLIPFAVMALFACQKSKLKPDTVPDVTITSSMDAFDGTLATVDIVLSHFIHSDVTVRIAIEGMDEEALPYDPVVVVPAGAVKKQLTLSIKPKLVELHKDYTVTVRLLSAEGANLKNAAPVSLQARIDEYRNWDFEPVFQSSWSMYAYVPSGYTTCWIYMYAAPAYYQIDMFPASEGDLADPSFLLKRMDAFADEINRLYEENKDSFSGKTDILCKWGGAAGYATYYIGSTQHWISTSEEGRWNLLMMEFDENLVPTGAYKNDAFTLAF